MSNSGKLAATVISTALVLSLAGASAGAPAQLIVGHRFKVHPHVTMTDYNNGKHEISGRVGLRNTAARGRRVSCRIVTTLVDQDGTARIKGDDHFRAHVGPNTTRKIPFDITIKDDPHRFNNLPSKTVGHCHTPYRN